MDVTVIGLAGCGKSTLLAALSGHAPSGGQLVTVKVPDPRIDKLAELFKPKKTTYAEIRSREAAWPGAESGKRRSEIDQYLEQIKGASLFLHVLRACETPTAAEPPDPTRDLDKLDTEMIFADLIVCDRLIERDSKQPMDPVRRQAVHKAKEMLEAEKPLWTRDWEENEEGSLTGLNMVTMTPQLVIVNLPEGETETPPLPEGKLHGRHVVGVSLAVAAEIATLPVAEQQGFAEEMGLGEPATHLIAREAFAQLDLISFFTVGPEEVRAWPIPKGMIAVKAAARIHSDIARGFIRGEVVDHELLLEMSTLKACREAGKLRLEGKTYVLQDGEIMHVRFNV
jgi:ribosome-binding ATPase